MEPIKPVTPPNSLVWRIVHFPLVLLVIGIAFMAGAIMTSAFVRKAFPEAANNWLAVLIAVLVAAVFVAFYWAFVRLVELRPAVAEFALNGWAKELGAGLLSGVILFSIVVGIIAALGGYRVIGHNPVSVLLPVLAISITSGVTEEIMLRGVFFRLIEILAGQLDRPDPVGGRVRRAAPRQPQRVAARRFGHRARSGRDARRALYADAPAMGGDRASCRLEFLAGRHLRHRRFRLQTGRSDRPAHQRLGPADRRLLRRRGLAARDHRLHGLRHRAARPRLSARPVRPALLDAKAPNSPICRNRRSSRWDRRAAGCGSRSAESPDWRGPPRPACTP